MEEKLKTEIIKALREASVSLAKERGWDFNSLPEPELEKPRNPEFGDWATNLALKMASVFKGKPREIAESMVRKLRLPEGAIRDVEIAGPGFINFRFALSWFKEIVREILKKKEDFGRLNLGKGRKVQVGFALTNST